MGSTERGRFQSSQSERVIFERGVDAFIMGIDGTWRRDVSQIRYRRTTSPLRTLSSAAKTMLSELIAAS
jgi:hypothetical protein